MGTFTLRGARHKIFDVHKQRTNSGVKEDPNRRALSKQYNDSCIFLDSHSYFHNNQLIPRIPQIMPKMVVSAFIVLLLFLFLKKFHISPNLSLALVTLLYDKIFWSLTFSAKVFGLEYLKASNVFSPCLCDEKIYLFKHNNKDFG